MYLCFLFFSKNRAQKYYFFFIYANKIYFFGIIIAVFLIVLRKIVISLFVLLSCVPLFARRHKPVVPDSLLVITLSVDGVPLVMRRVEGGSFMMGATIDQTDPDVYSDKPAHMVQLSPFYIAQTEVTYQLWHRVMPEHESLHPKGYPTNPISYVTWWDCKEFIRRLDSITGLPFRLPTEAEWEYAARGGQDSRHYRYAGGNEPDSVGWTHSCSGDWTHPVARKRPNEAGLYDMTGNVAEWCEDRYAPYQLGTEPNPCVSDTINQKIVRGGSYDDCVANSHLSIRRWYPAETSRGYIGLRLAMTLPDDPVILAERAENAQQKSVRVQGKKIHFDLVPAEQPYFISEEISAALWRKMMMSEPPQKAQKTAVGMSMAERVQFAEYCSREAREVMQVASPEETLLAANMGIIPPVLKEAGTLRKRTNTKQLQHKRRVNKSLSPWAEMLGIRMPKPDDPVLLQFKEEGTLSRPLRLVIKAH